jgi:uncharacterized protein YndB with AHSA1/START domain
MIEVAYETDVAASAEKIFDAIVDLRGYDRWLTESSAFRGTTEISPGPLAVGTTYAEPAPTGTRNGTVTELEPPTRVTFHQPMTMKPRVLGVMDITLRYTLTPSEASTRVRRASTFTLPWQLKLGRAYVVRQFRAEHERVMLALKAFAEGLP